MDDAFSVTLTAEDIVDAYRPAPRPRRLAALLLLLALSIVLLIAALLVRFPEARLAFARSPVIAGLSGAVVLAASLVALLLLSAPALRRRAARSTLEHHPGMGDPIHYAFNAAEFAVRTSYTQARYPWGELWDWRETDRVVIVMPSPRNFYVVPKRAMDPAAQDRLRAGLAQARRPRR